MATVNGAKQIGLIDHIGTLESGKFADITAVNLNHVNTIPVYDPVSTLIYSAQASQVSHVWVAGKLNVEDGKFTHTNEEILKDKAQHWAEKIQTA